jgi:hypothetical protein
MSKKKPKTVHISPIVWLVATVMLLLILVFIIGGSFLFQERTLFNQTLSGDTGCDKWFDRQPNHSMPSPDIFFTVNGQVNGSPLPNATVYLYVVSDTRRSTVLDMIQNSTPVKKTPINATNGFTFPCISPGHYAAVMPGSSFDGPINGPVPHTWQHNGHALTVSLHGYDLNHRNLAVAFSIKPISEHDS